MKAETSTKKTPKMSPDKRFDYMIEQVREKKELWVLHDDNGCVMLTTEDEDCIPVWPSEEAAREWAQEDWQDCQPLSVSLWDWQERWTPGMADDDLLVAVFPLVDDLGVVVSPYEFDETLSPKKSH
ncbi:MAG: hypothetical protein PWP74_529 [Shewanella sp.]|uniref:Uncharacterized protein DUF2750 n=2 Tax=Shewanellaceae TaxID=267890 RepID=A0A4R2FGR2_9GAMM|nr:hypothetical protein [Shewanella sp.]TCN87901.1 uncharacterized protein DUF2750 [Shewanella fodinae]GGZ01402.1 DUF2750 domain-containing protein [Shewanella fodinae]